MIDIILCILFGLTAVSEIMLWQTIMELRQYGDLLSRRITRAHDRLTIIEEKQQWEKLVNAPIECVERSEQ